MDNENTRKGMPLLGESFPEMTVKTTHGEFDLPSHFEGN